MSGTSLTASTLVSSFGFIIAPFMGEMGQTPHLNNPSSFVQLVLIPNTLVNWV